MSTFYLRTNVHCLTGMIASLLTLLSFVNTLHGQELDQLSAHIDARTSALVRVDSAALDTLIDAAKQSGKDSEQTVLQLRLKQTRDILGNDPIWLTMGFPMTPLSVQILVRDPDGKRIEKLKDLWDFPKRPPYGRDPQVVIRRLKESDQRGTANPARLDQWQKLMDLPADIKAQRGTIQFGCLPPANLYDTYLELLTDLPDYLGGGPVTVLTDGLQNISGTIDLKTGALEATIGSASPEAASAFSDQATQSLARFNALNVLSWMQSGDRSPNGLVVLIRALLQRSTFKPVESQVRWQIDAGDWIPKKILELVVGPQSNRSATRRLRDLALGILNYESANRHFPPPRKANQSSGLSWRVHILPYLGKDEAHELHQKFKLDEPWDSPTNIKLLPQMPNIYSDYGAKLLSPASAKPGYTTVVAPISENTILGAPRTVTFRAITDGTSNTILLVIVKDSLAVPWTAPQDYVFDPKQPADGLQFTDGKVPVVFCDGSTELLSKDNDAETWVGTFEMNDGGIVRAK